MRPERIRVIWSERVPIDFVKLGTQFINGLTTDGRRRRKATNAVLKAHRNGEWVIAQGVEELVTLQFLQELSIDEAQGHALGPRVDRVTGRPAGLSRMRS
jgi:EAL domain-containing protein (putative c-di-GMP-specific phosphodiesterase class I)